MKIVVNSVYQDEPVNGKGDGDRSPDVLGIGTGNIKLRSERSGTDNGRVYTVNFSALDTQGGSCDGRLKVVVPKDGGKKGQTLDKGSLFDSTLIFK